MIGSTFYLTVTRPDITYNVQLLNQLINRPTTKHLKAITPVLRYLKHTHG